MHGRCQIPVVARTILAALAVAAAIGSSGIPSAHAQTRDGFAQPVTFKVVNATTRSPGAVDRLTIDYLTARPNNIVDTRPSGSTFTIGSVPLRDAGQYIVTAWWQNVPYWFSFTGREMVADTLTIHVFDTFDDLQAVTVTGLNLVVQRQGETLKLEYMLQVDNATSPQRTIMASDHTLTMAVPGGLQDIDATYRRGPDPTPIATGSLGTDRLGLSVPLTWGQNTIRLTGRVPWSEDMTLPVGFNVPVRTWSLLVSPDWLEVQGLGLEPDPSSEFQGYGRFRGPEIEAGRRVTMKLSGGGLQGTPEAHVFATAGDSTASGSDEETAADQGGGMGFPLRLVLVLALVGLILLFVANRRTRS